MLEILLIVIYLQLISMVLGEMFGTVQLLILIKLLCGDIQASKTMGKKLNLKRRVNKQCQEENIQSMS